jgi:hypothetical protein
MFKVSIIIIIKKLIKALWLRFEVLRLRKKTEKKKKIDTCAPKAGK